MDDQKEEIGNLRKQIKGLKISLMLTQISTVVFTIILADASKLIGLPAAAIRAGIVYRWLPIGMAIHNNKPAKSLSEGRITYIISPRKVWEVTGHVWKGKEAL